MSPIPLSQYKRGGVDFCELGKNKRERRRKKESEKGVIFILINHWVFLIGETLLLLQSTYYQRPKNLSRHYVTYIKLNFFMRNNGLS